MRAMAATSRTWPIRRALGRRSRWRSTRRRPRRRARPPRPRPPRPHRCRRGPAGRRTGCRHARRRSRPPVAAWRPSRPSDAGLGPVPHAASPAAGQGGALERGSLIHHALQHAPALPPAEREAAVRGYLAAAAGAPGVLAEVMGIIGHPALARCSARRAGRSSRCPGWWAAPWCPASSTAWPCCRTRCCSPTTRPTATPRPRGGHARALPAADGGLPGGGAGDLPGPAGPLPLVWTRSATVMPLPDALLRHAMRRASLIRPARTPISSGAAQETWHEREHDRRQRSRPSRRTCWMRTARCWWISGRSGAARAR